MQHLSIFSPEMATQSLTEYERKRLDNIKRNDELLASLNIKQKLSDLSNLTKRNRTEKKLKSKTPTIIRRSLRTQGKPPDKSLRELGPISMRDASISSESDEELVDKITSVCKKSEFEKYDDDCQYKFRVRASIDLHSMDLTPENVARIVQKPIFSVKFFPSADIRMVAVGTKFGNLGFWNVDSENEDNDGIYIYHPHPKPVSSIIIQPFSMNKVITSCYDGQIRSLDIEKEIFNLTCKSKHPIYSMYQRSDDVNSLYFGEGCGGFNIWDERSGRSSLSCDLHEFWINTIDLNSQNINLMATSSSDSTACIWDLRKLGKSKPESVKIITRERAVHSAYFSPSGSHLATTSIDDKIGVLGGPNYDDEYVIDRTNDASKVPSFKGVWGWDDSYLFVGNMKRGIDVISTSERRVVRSLESDHMTSVPTRFDAHPFIPGMLAGATYGGQVYIWRSYR